MEEKKCVKCGDKLTGHEDENGTHCRWCVTCQDSSQDDTAESNAEICRDSRQD